MSEKEESTESPESTPNRPEGQKITIDIPKGLSAVYSNVAFISHTPAEIVLDFAQVLPRITRGTVMARVIMSPIHAKMLQMALTQNISNFERQYGKITLPQQMSLANQFFRFPKQEPDDQGEDKEE
jgi:hypothetical protein